MRSHRGLWGWRRRGLDGARALTASRHRGWTPLRDRRTFSALVGGGLLLALVWPTTSSAPAVPVNRPPVPTADRLAMLSELAHWTHGSERDFSLFGTGPLPALALN